MKPSSRRQTKNNKTASRGVAKGVVRSGSEHRLLPHTEDAAAREAAIVDILRVISASPGDLQPVFDTILEHTIRLCQGNVATLWQFDGERLCFAAAKNATEESVAHSRNHPLELGTWNPTPQAALERRVVHVLDVFANPNYRPLIPAGTSGKRPNAGTVLAVPLLREDELFGVITIWRYEKRRFSEREIELVKTFTAQAVIAIENVRLFNETKDALERQTATAEILRVISSSPADVQPVFETILAHAIRLCEGDTAVLWQYDGSHLRFAAVRQAVAPRPPETGPGSAYLRNNPLPLGKYNPTPQAALERRTIHVADVFADPNYRPLIPKDKFGSSPNAGTVLAVPLMRQDELLGVISIWRFENRLFTAKQIAMIETFADQAVIAIENVRLFNETKESLEQQTAISEVLRVISSSPADVQPVLEAVAERAARICEAVDAQIFLREGDDLKHVARFGPIPIGIKLGDARPLSRGWVAGRAVLEGRAIHIEDLLAVPREEYPVSHELRDRAGHRTLLSVPLMREQKALGAFSLRRMEVRPFSDKQIALLQTFADQAAIAIENVRLFNETKEALDQQKATADVLGAISSSIADTRPVFEKILDSCTRLFGGHDSGIGLVGGDGLVHLAAHHGAHAVDLGQVFPVPLTPESGTGSAILERRVMHYPDVFAGVDVPSYVRRSAEKVNFRSVVFAPMFWEDKGIGAIWVGRPFAGAFSEKQIALLRSFADQAVIAIQNAKLFREIQEKSAQLEVANKHKSDFLANMSHELRTPLNAIIGFSEALQDRLFGEINEKQTEYLRDIHESGRHLLSLINDILDLSKIEAGRMELEVSSFHLPSAISNAMTLIRERAQRHGIELGLEVDPRLDQFNGDERKFKQIMLNLLSNAVKFTPDGGRVDVLARMDTDKVEIAVKDTGIGIAPEDQAAVFEEFRQVGRDKMRKAEGTGLGLALTRRFVELHGGAIRLESTPGKGSTFTVSLPLRQ